MTVRIATLLLFSCALVGRAATFNGNARIEVADTSGGLSWNGSGLTVACWFKISIPSGTNLAENMTVLVNRKSGNDASAYAYLIQFNVSNGNVEFVTSTGTPFTYTLIERPYLERWYHVAITRDSGGNFVGYADGRVVFTANNAVGTSTDGVSIGGWNASGSQGRFFFGDIQEIAIHQAVLSAPQVRAFMFTDLPVTNLAATLRGYFKLAYSTNATNFYRNFALNPPAGATEGQPSGPVQFEEVDLGGEQSLFDSRKNGGAQALVALSGSFAWQQTALARPTPGVAFDWRIGYSSANTASGVKLGEFDPFDSPDLGRGWRHTFEARILPEGGLSEVRILQWDGSIETWLQTTNSPAGTHYRTRHREYRGELLRRPDGEFEWTTPDSLVHHFRNPIPSEFDPPTDDPFLLKKGFIEDIRDFNGNSVAVSRDLLGRMDRVLDSARGVYVFSYTNNLVSAVTFGPWVARFSYDNTNRLVSKSLTNTSGIHTNVNTTWRFSYNASNGLLQAIIDPRGITNQFVQYDQYGRKTNEVDALGRATQTRYGVPGKMQITHVDPATNSWIETYDRKGRILAQRDPLGNETSYTYDDSGNRTSITEPLGWKTFFAYDSRANVIARTHAYDGRGRLTKWTDAENFDWLYDYDGNGNITNITDALGGHYVMSYGPRNERLFEQNQDTNIWRYTYDELARLKIQTDPNGTTRTVTYDAGGRVRLVHFGTGRINSFSYDKNNNPVEMERIDADLSFVTSTLGYDAMDRLTSYSDDLTLHEVLYGHDALGRITTVTYPGGKTLTQQFDAISRLTSQVFEFDASRRFTNSYAYDQADRLIRRAYPNGVVQSNAFDTAGRITALSYSALNSQPSTVKIALTYAYDRNGNKTGATEKGTLDWQLPPLTDELANYTAAGKLKTRSIHTNAPGVLPSPGGEGQGEGGIPSPSPLNGERAGVRGDSSPKSGINQSLLTSAATMTYSYDPSGNMTNAALTGGASPQSWAHAYDEDNRTTTIRWTTNAQTHTVLNQYDAFGRRVSRTLNGSETQYVLDLSGSMERILCDLDAGGGITAWYVHGPDLAFKVDAGGNLTCYHADAQANIIALTGPNGTNLALYAYTPYGTNLALYAYTPYGRSLGSTNLQSQISNPYLFVGSQGVMEELPGLYFMRARYYSAEAGVFLSTDPVKKIGPGWKPVAYEYVGGNPLLRVDPDGESGIIAGAFYGFLKRITLDVMDTVSVSVGTVIFGLPEEEMRKATQQIRNFEDTFADHTIGKAFPKSAIRVGELAAQWLEERPYEHPANQYVPHQTDWSTIASGPTFQKSPAYQQIKSMIDASPLIGVGGGGGATSGMANKTPAAANNATVANASQSQQSASPGNQSGSTSNSGGGSGSAGRNTASSASSSTTYTLKGIRPAKPARRKVGIAAALEA